MTFNFQGLLLCELFRARMIQLKCLNKNVCRNFRVSSRYSEKKNNKLETSAGENSPDLKGNDVIEVNEKEVTTQKKEAKISEKKRDPEDKIVSLPHYSGFSEFVDLQNFVENPLARCKRALKFDYLRQKEKLMDKLNIKYTPKAMDYYYGPSHTDVLIIGGGAMGSACAYFLKEQTRDGLEVTIVEKDMSYRTTSPFLSVFGLNQQFTLPENIEMSSYAVDFLREMHYTLKVDTLPDPDLYYEPYGNLVLATEQGAGTLEENSKIQRSMGVKTRLLTPQKLNEMFPWLKTDGIALGSLGLEKEGWFDPLMLMLAFKSKASELGTNVIPGEIVGFQYILPGSEDYPYDDVFRKVRGAVIRRPDGNCHIIKFAYCIVAAGANSGLVGKLLGLGAGKGPLSVPLPIEPRRRTLYFIHCLGGPSLNMPLMMDPTGLCIRRVGVGGHYAVTDLSAEPNHCEDKESYIRYFEEELKPKLLARIPSLRNATVDFYRSGYHQSNVTDPSGIVGQHPFFHNVLFACGFDSESVQHTPAVGLTTTELILHSSYHTMNLRNLEFTRFSSGRLMHEKRIT